MRSYAGERCLEQGMDAYLSKPLRMSELRLMPDKWLAERDSAGADV